MALDWIAGEGHGPRSYTCFWTLPKHLLDKIATSLGADGNTDEFQLLLNISKVQFPYYTVEQYAEVLVPRGLCLNVEFGEDDMDVDVMEAFVLATVHNDVKDIGL